MSRIIITLEEAREAKRNAPNNERRNWWNGYIQCLKDNQPKRCPECDAELLRFPDFYACPKCREQFTLDEIYDSSEEKTTQVTHETRSQEETQ